MKAHWTPQALASLNGKFMHLRRRDPAAALRAQDRLKESVGNLSAFPGSGRAGRQPGTRELVLGDLPCLVVYQAQADRVVVLEVLHTSREWPMALN